MITYFLSNSYVIINVLGATLIPREYLGRDIKKSRGITLAVIPRVGGLG